MKITTMDMMLASISRMLDKGFVMPCCRRDLDRFLQMYILSYRGIETPIGNGLFRIILSNAGALQDILKIGHFEIHVLDAKNAPRVRIHQYACHYCKDDSALIIISARFVLSLWRFQMVVLGLITAAERRPDGRLSIRCRYPDRDDLKQLDIARDVYFGAQQLSFDGVDELLKMSSKSPEQLGQELIESVNIALLWILAHEAAHLMPDREETWSCADLARGAYTRAESYLKSQSVSAEDFPNWVAELAADVLGTHVLVSTLRDAFKSQISDAEVLRRAVLSKVATGVCTALHGIEFASICAPMPQGHQPSHPECSDRWQLIAGLLETSRVNPEDIFGTAKVQLRIAETLFDSWPIVP